MKGEPLRYVNGHSGGRCGPGSRYVEEDRGFDTPCWIWQGTKAPNGYGRLTVRGETKSAHRLYWEERYGRIPPGMTLDHLCRQRACVNPDHLEVVTARVNVQRGQLAKLTPDTVREIRARAAAGAPQARLAQQFGVDQSTVSRVVTGARGDWSNVA